MSVRKELYPNKAKRLAQDLHPLGNSASFANNHNDTASVPQRDRLIPLGLCSQYRRFYNTLGKTTANDGERSIYWLFCPGSAFLRWACAAGGLFQPSSIGGGVAQPGRHRV